MEDENRTPYADDALNVENGTPPDEVQHFVERRAMNPVKVAGLTVWNFNNHTINQEKLAKQAGDFIYDEYVIPFQASGVWGYMIQLLPERIAEAEILTYNQSRGQYNPYPNYIRHSDEDINDAIRERIRERTV